MPGLQPLRKELLDSAQEYYQDFLRDAATTASVRAEARDALERTSKTDQSLAGTYPVSRYNLACDLALMIPIAPPDRRESLAKQAVDAIRQAASAGYADIKNMETDTDLVALHPAATSSPS